MPSVEGSGSIRVILGSRRNLPKAKQSGNGSIARRSDLDGWIGVYMGIDRPICKAC